jgi:hypothetical protein
VHALNVEDRGDQAAELQVEERASDCECEGEGADQRPSAMVERLGLKLRGPKVNRLEDLRLEDRIQFEGEASQGSDDAGTGIEVFLALSAGLEVVPEGLFVRDRRPGGQSVIDHALENFVPVR